IQDGNGCLDSLELEIVAPDSLSIDAEIINVLCFEENNGSIDLEVAGGTPGYNYSWSGPNGFNSDQDSIGNLVPGSYEVQVQDMFNCTTTAQYEIEEAIAIEVVVDNVTDPSCISAFDGAIDITVMGGVPDYNFAWSGPNEFTSFEEDVSGLGEGNYDLLVMDANGCNFSVDAIPLVGLGDVTAIAPTDSSWCFGNIVVLTGGNTGADTEGWLLEDGTLLSDSAQLSIDWEPGIYVLTYFATDGPCEDTDQVTIEIFDPAVADAGQDQFIYQEEIALLGGEDLNQGDVTILWSPSDLVQDSSTFNTSTIELFTDQVLIQTVTTENGCQAQDTVQVNIIPEIDIPDGFTPNDDGKNDVWQLGNIAFYPSTTVTIFNRWGEELYQSQGYSEPWDGMYQGNPLPIGTYYYVIRVNEPEFQDEITGPLTILR
ncbi:MAG: gliding motility-associated C-terminal domain-containing protein, partial [Bacteroidota bacterium]